LGFFGRWDGMGMVRVEVWIEVWVVNRVWGVERWEWR